jgi:hypothetical protein
VLLHRLKAEYGVAATLSNLPYGFARWVTGPKEEIERLGASAGRSLVYDAKNRPLLLFESEWTMRHTIDRHTDLSSTTSRPELRGGTDLRHEEERGDAQGAALLCGAARAHAFRRSRGARRIPRRAAPLRAEVRRAGARRP